jgi:phospho-N-acetylmuramoyl-pentapeptide-transferase
VSDVMNAQYILWGVWGVCLWSVHFFGIRLFKKFQVHQSIYEDSPDSHQQKQGTPTMGGVFIGISFFSAFFLVGVQSYSHAWVLFVTGVFFLIGFIDDSLGLIRKTNKGMSARFKFVLQLVFSGVVVGLYHFGIDALTWGEGVLYVFLLVGTSNACNLTDGVDGLLSSTMIVSLIGVWLLCGQLGRYDMMPFLWIMGIVLCVFLCFNWRPASIFMGDTGSLMLGGFLAAMCIVTQQWIVLLGVGAIYVIETLSVMVQVISYKLRKQRIFLMTPLHHHFELLGYTEVQVVGIFLLIQSVFVCVQVWI